jgi:hypothetical protein
MKDFEARSDVQGGIHFSPEGRCSKGSTATADNSFAMANVTSRMGALRLECGSEGSRHGERQNIRSRMD